MSFDPARPAGPVNRSASDLPEDVVLSVRNVGKCYHIYPTPKDRLKQAFFRRWRTFYRPFWALRDVSFDIRRGEAVGIVGRNGSGKSTLLQIITGTLAPTTGEVRVRGRIAALLELGSGFNPDFTGRENVYLNAAILGVPKREVDARFDEIADFADIGEFLDQPVRTYSSGMHARLAFSVAVSVEPDILILDEILAVGDMGFQQRCVARMRQLLDSGVTLMFVSHGPDAVKSLCRKGLFLRDGRAAYFGSAEEAVDRYFGHIRAGVNRAASGRMAPSFDAGPSAGPIGFQSKIPARLRYGSGHGEIMGVRLLDSGGRSVQMFRLGETITIEATIRAKSPLDNLDVAFVIRDPAGVDLLGTGTSDERVPIPPLNEGSHATIRFRLTNILRKGNYGISLTLTRLPGSAEVGGITLDHVDGCIAFQSVTDGMRAVHHKVHHPVSVDLTVEHGGSSAATPQTSTDSAQVG